MNQHPGVIKAYILIGAAIVAGGSIYAILTNINKTNEQEAAQLPLQVSGVKSVNEIRDIAGANLEEDIEIVSILLEEEDAGLIYKVKLSDGSLLFYSATTGEAVIDPSKDSDDDEDELVEDESIPAGFVAKISLIQARTTAEAQRPGQIVDEIELEVEHGVIVYSVKFVDESRVDVNATTGEVMRIKLKEQEDSSSATTSTDDDEEDSEDDEDEAERTDIDVTIENNAFAGLSSMTVNKETRIKIENEDDVAHTFTINGLGINITIQPDSDEEITFTPTQIGTYTVQCTLQSFTGQISVVN